MISVLLISLILGLEYCSSLEINVIKETKERDSPTETRRIPSFYYKHPKNGILEALVYYDVKHPHIVYAQALLESGHFKSKVFREYNNMFGLYNSKKKDYYRFKHWTESILAYKRYIQYRYKSGCYYKFLKDIKYAEDPMYILKLKRIIKREFND